jgi:uncharacterized protein (DUF2141 family)
MSKNILRILIVTLSLFIISCAKRGTITGGDKDTIAPVLKASFPKNFSTNFNGKEIKLVFNEYVKLKNVNKQLIISPPMKNQPEILPYVASKIITIKLKDSLHPNTTYSFNFGQSIEDNNESNAMQQFKYVFSTGKFIDSLNLKVKVKDALNKKVDSNVSVMLYEVNEKFNDSTIYKETPRYITNTLDSLKIVTIENIKAGKYALIALKDNGNNKFDAKSDKIGFQKNYINIPNDTIFEVELFKEQLPFKTVKPKQDSGNRILMGYEGNPKNIKISVKNGNDLLQTVVTKFPKKDSLQIWHKPLKADSLKVIVEKENFQEIHTIKLRSQKNDTLKLTPEFSGNLPLRERFSINSSTPLVKFDKSKIKVINKDSIVVSFTTEYDELNQRLFVDFKNEPLERYKISFLKGALTDFFEKSNELFDISLNTKNSSDYGNLRVVLENVKRYPVIVELTDKSGSIKAVEYSEKKSVIDFNKIDPALYTLRVIYDDNKNKMWDTGSYHEKRQSEEVIYYPKYIDIRANWDVEQTFNLKTNN